MKATTAQLLIDQQKKIDELERAIGDILLICIKDNHEPILNSIESASDSIRYVTYLKNDLNDSKAKIASLQDKLLEYEPEKQN